MQRQVVERKSHTYKIKTSSFLSYLYLCLPLFLSLSLSHVRICGGGGDVLSFIFLVLIFYPFSLTSVLVAMRS